MAIKRFQRGSFGRGGGVYVCRVCERKTRATIDCEASIELCGHCSELAMIENGISDNGEAHRPTYQAQIDRHIAALRALGVDVAAVWPDFAGPVAAETPAAHWCPWLAEAK